VTKGKGRKPFIGKGCGHFFASFAVKVRIIHNFIKIATSVVLFQAGSRILIKISELYKGTM